MSSDTNDPGNEHTEKIDVRVPVALLERIDEEYEHRGYTSRSEAIRDALRDWLDPQITLSDEILEDLTESRRQRGRGETRSAADVREHLGLNTDDE